MHRRRVPPSASARSAHSSKPGSSSSNGRDTRRPRSPRSPAPQTPSLRGAMWRSTGNTERAIVEQLVADGSSPEVARVAAASVLAALVAGLYSWADGEHGTLAEAIEHALDVI